MALLMTPLPFEIGAVVMDNYVIQLPFMETQNFTINLLLYIFKDCYISIENRSQKDGIDV